MKKILILSNWEGRGDGIKEALDGLKRDYTFLKIYQGERIQTLQEYSAIMISGAPFFVSQENEHDFLKWEFDLVREAIKKNIPVLGVCFGAQVLGHVLGGKIGKTSTPEVGLLDVNLTEEGIKHKLFNGFFRTFKMFQYHFEEVQSVPGVNLLASSEITKIQAFETKNKLVLAVQFHPEISLEMSSKIFTEEHIKKLNEKGAVPQLNAQNFNSELRKIFFKNFLEIVDEVTK